MLRWCSDAHKGLAACRKGLPAVDRQAMQGGVHAALTVSFSAIILRWVSESISFFSASSCMISNQASPHVWVTHAQNPPGNGCIAIHSLLLTLVSVYLISCCTFFRCSAITVTRSLFSSMAASTRCSSRSTSCSRGGQHRSKLLPTEQHGTQS